MAVKIKNDKQPALQNSRHHQRTQIHCVKNINKNDIADDAEQNARREQNRFAPEQQKSPDDLHECDEITVNRRKAEIMSSQPKTGNFAERFVEFRIENRKLRPHNLRPTVGDDDESDEITTKIVNTLFQWRSRILIFH